MANADNGMRRAAPRNALPRVLLAAGGTGGHIFPALAVAEELLAGGAEVLWLAAGGMERQLIEKRGLPLYVAPFSPPSGIFAPLRLAAAVLRALFVLRRIRPDVVLGMGGYASAPGCLAAWLLRLPVLIHEQNAVAGRANRLLSRFVSIKLTGFPDVFPGGIWVGNPVRRGFSSVAASPPSSPSEALRLLVLGGSQGARALNKVVPQAAALLARGRRIRITHQCGAGNGEETTAAYRAAGGGGECDVEVAEFIDDVAAALGAADVVVCRAGASTLAELTASAAAAVLVPYPYAAAAHQTANARFFAARRAAVLCAESDLTPAWLADFLHRTGREELTALGRRCAELASPAAAADIANYCLKEAGHAA